MQYRLLERIGSGGMAEVFRANAQGPHGFSRTFVIKRILPRLAASPEFLHMFLDEARISARLSHPNIVQMFAFAEQGGTPLLVMEHVDGRDLGAMLRRVAERGQSVPPAVVAEIGRQCCLALDYAHRLSGPDGTPLGIVHRDVTPSNIMVSWDGVVKLLDFGIARAAQQVRSHETAAGIMKGKLSYVAPELINGGVADKGADLFALGAVLHEALTGRRLFAGDNDLATLKNVLEMPIPLPSRLNPQVSRTLDRIVMRALRRNPRERFASAGDMAAELEGYLHRIRAPGTALRGFLTALYGDERGRAGAAAAVAGDDGLDGTIIVDEVELVGGERVVRPPATPQPPPVPVAMQAAASGPTRVEPSRRGLVTRRRRGRMVAAMAFVAALVLVGRVLAVHQRADARAATAAGDGGRVEVTLDSVPQGAAVARQPDGAPLGETPLLLELPRGRAPVAVWLRKSGYETQSFKLIPHRDHAATVNLHRVGRPTTASLEGEAQ